MSHHRQHAVEFFGHFAQTRMRRSDRNRVSEIAAVQYRPDDPARTDRGNGKEHERHSDDRGRLVRGMIVRLKTRLPVKRIEHQAKSVEGGKEDARSHSETSEGGEG